MSERKDEVKPPSPDKYKAATADGIEGCVVSCPRGDSVARMGILDRLARIEATVEGMRHEFLGNGRSCRIQRIENKSVYKFPHTSAGANVGWAIIRP